VARRGVTVGLGPVSQGIRLATHPDTDLASCVTGIHTM
jgi:hypothetical protein